MRSPDRTLPYFNERRVVISGALFNRSHEAFACGLCFRPERAFGFNRAADRYQPNAAENQCYGYGFEEGEAVKSQPYANRGGHYGLNIVIHSNYGRPQVFLSYHYADVGDIGRADDYRGHSEPFGCADDGPVG